MTELSQANFRLTILNPGGRDPEQRFPDGAGEISQPHAPINFHAYAACTRGSFHRETKSASAEGTPVLVLLRSDFRASERALTALQSEGRVVAVSLKETGLHQIAQQLRDPAKLARFTQIVKRADGCIAPTPEAADFYRAIHGGERVAFVPTPYPVEDPRWNFSQPLEARSGIFIGTREWDVPSRNHLAALLLARSLSEETGEQVTVFNYDGRKGARLLAEIGFVAAKLRVLDSKLAYPDYLREVAKHKIVSSTRVSSLARLPATRCSAGFPASAGMAPLIASRFPRAAARRNRSDRSARSRRACSAIESFMSKVSP
jgi:hypothetical protein